MAPYAPLPSGPSGTNSGPSSPRRSVSFRERLSGHHRRRSQVPDPSEMDRAFDDPGDDDEHDAHEGQQLLGNNGPSSSSPQRSAPLPGDYDFDRDYFLPPPGSPPPFEDYSASNPAPGNSNGIVPTEPVARPRPNRHFLGGILPLSFLPRRQPAVPPSIGGGQSGVFANLSARPDPERRTNPDDPDYANEDEQKDAPPSYQTALRDAVPPYWDTTVVLPSSSSPFGPLSSSISGDDILIDGMPAGNMIGFLWNLIVSTAFQFVGFLLTYVLHTTHAAKFGSRAGLGITLVSVGFKLRGKAEETIQTGHFEGSDQIDPVTGKTQADLEAERLMATWGNNIEWPQPWSPPTDWGGHGEIYTLHSAEEANNIAHQYNHTFADMMNNPVEIAQANLYFSLMLMTIGWFLILASIGGWWRIKRFEYKLKEAQRESERAQRAARGSIDELNPDETEEDTETGREPGPTELSYYTSAFTQTLNGMREIQRGFFGMRGRNIERGDTVFNSHDDDDEQALLAAQGYGLEPMARPDSDPDSPTRRRGGGGLWT